MSCTLRYKQTESIELLLYFGYHRLTALTAKFLNFNIIMFSKTVQSTCCHHFEAPSSDLIMLEARTGNFPRGAFFTLSLVVAYFSVTMIPAE